MICLMQPGDHLRVQGVAGFMALTHHALYIGDGRVMHFTGGVTEKANATVKIDTLHKLTKYMKSVGNKSAASRSLRARTHARIHTHTQRYTHTRTHTYTHRSFRIRRRRCRGRKSWSVLVARGPNRLQPPLQNCEHVVLWCITGEEFSQQVDRLTKDPIGLGLTICRSRLSWRPVASG